MFWEGFYKRAALGTKAVKPISSTGRLVGNKPTTGVSMVSAYKKSPLPTATRHAASQISSPKLNTSGTISEVPKPKGKNHGGVGETRI